MNQLTLFAAETPVAMPELYTVFGYWDGDEDPDAVVITYRNVPRREALVHYARGDELAAMVASGEVRHTSKACMGWRYRIVRQATPLDVHLRPIPPPWRNVDGTHLWVTGEAAT